MATAKQEDALNKMVENGGIASKAMVEAGYSANTAKTPSKLTSSIGFLELCEQSGLTDSFLLTALVEDIQSKKGVRKAELELGFRIKGRLNSKEIVDEPELSPAKLPPEEKARIDAILDDLLKGCENCKVSEKVYV